MLLPAELAQMQADAAAWLDQACTRRRTATSANGAGGQTAGAASTVATVCRVRPVSERASEAIEAGQLQASVDFEVLLPPAADVKATDELAIGGATYQVLGTDAGSSEPSLLVAYCKRI